jgi:hypothetical protein
MLLLSLAARAQCQLGKVVLADGAANDLFGSSCAVGNAMFVGASLDDVQRNNSGSLSVLQPNGPNFWAPYRLEPLDSPALLGRAASTSAGVTLVGACEKAYMFEAFGGVWS